MPTPPKRFKAVEDFTPEEHLRQLQAERRGQDPPQVETAEFRRYKADGLRTLGLADEADSVEPDHAKRLEEMTPDDHLRQLRGDAA